MHSADNVGSARSHSGLSDKTHQRVTHLSHDLRERLLRVQEVSYKLAVRDSWVYDHAPELGGVRLFGLLRFRESELDRWIAEQALAPQR